MKKIYFEDRFGERRLLAARNTDEEVWQVINNFLTEHRYKAPYVRSWTDDEGTWYDVGSHSEFFLVRNET